MENLIQRNPESESGGDTSEKTEETQGETQEENGQLKVDETPTPSNDAPAEKRGIAAVRREAEYVAPSGIKTGILSLTGIHQSMITINDTKERRKGIDKMMLDSISFIGDNTEPTMADIKKMLEPDRSAILFEIRQLSNKRNPKFKFKYEFPVKDGQRRTQIVSVNFNTKDFPFVPFKWVRDEMEKQYRTKEGIEEGLELSELQKHDCYIEKVSIPLESGPEEIEQARPFPEMFKSYDEILELYSNQSLVLPESGVTLRWNLLDIETAERFVKNVDKSTISSHSQLEMRSPKIIDENLTTNEDNPVLIPAPLDIMDWLDVEAGRKSIMDIEAQIETMIIVQYEDDVNEQAQVDLVTTAAFFFPSLAN